MEFSSGIIPGFHRYLAAAPRESKENERNNPEPERVRKKRRKSKEISWKERPLERNLPFRVSNFGARATHIFHQKESVIIFLFYFLSYMYIYFLTRPYKTRPRRLFLSASRASICIYAGKIIKYIIKNNNRTRKTRRARFLIRFNFAVREIYTASQVSARRFGAKITHEAARAGCKMT